MTTMDGFPENGLLSTPAAASPTAGNGYAGPADVGKHVANHGGEDSDAVVAQRHYATVSKEGHQVNRKALVRITGVGTAIAGLLIGANLAGAGSTGLDGGGGCYGTGSTSHSPGSPGVVSASTFSAGAPCGPFTDVYLEADTPSGYADYSGSWGTLGIYWGTGAPSVQGTHNLCHMSCNGYVNTSAP